MTFFMPVTKRKPKGFFFFFFDNAITKSISLFWCFESYTDNLLIPTPKVIT